VQGGGVFWLVGLVTVGAEAFEAYLLAFDEVALFESLDEGEVGVVEAACGAAVSAEEVGVALDVGASVGEFVVPGSVLEVGPVDDSGGGKGLESAVDGDFVGVVLCDELGDLFLCEGAGCVDEDVEDGGSGACVPEAGVS